MSIFVTVSKIFVIAGLPVSLVGTIMDVRLPYARVPVWSMCEAAITLEIILNVREKVLFLRAAFE